MKSESNDLISSDIDECAMKTSNCDSDARCTNTEGSFNCSCNRGYDGDGTNCTGKKVYLPFNTYQYMSIIVRHTWPVKMNYGKYIQIKIKHVT